MTNTSLSGHQRLIVLAAKGHFEEHQPALYLLQKIVYLNDDPVPLPETLNYLRDILMTVRNTQSAEDWENLSRYMFNNALREMSWGENDLLKALIKAHLFQIFAIQVFDKEDCLVDLEIPESLKYKAIDHLKNYEKTNTF